MQMLYAIVMNLEGSNKKYNQPDIDEEIFCRIAANDMDAFETLYNLTKRSVYSYALSILKNQEDAMDVLQETFLKIRGAAHLYRPMGKPLAWIFTITRNLSMSRLRTNVRVNVLSNELLEDDLSLSYKISSDDKLVLQAALKILDQEEREIILLHAISGFKHREIAKALSLSLGTVLSKYHRGINKLRKYLKGQGVHE